MKNKFTLIFILTVLVSVLGFSTEKPKTPRTQSLMLSGKIIDINSNEKLAGVKITCANCEKSFYSDLEGNFFIYLETSSTENLTLEISQIGYSTKTLYYKDIQANSGNLYIDLKSE